MALDLSYLEIHQQFPNVPNHTSNTEAYNANLWITQGDKGSGYVDFWVQFTSSGGYDWWIGSGPCPIRLYIRNKKKNGTWNEIEIKSNNGISGMENCNMPGSGSSGVENSPLTLFYNEYEVNSSESQVRMTVDCSVVPIISGSWTPGFLDTGWVSGVFSNIETGESEFGEVPKLNSILNNDRFNYQDEVSNSTTSISIAINANWGIPYGKANWSCGDKVGVTRNSIFTINGLTPGTGYTVAVYIKNKNGVSDTKYITIRTRHNQPTVSISLVSVDLERLIFHWVSDKPLQSTQYRINSTWVDSGQSGTSGDLIIQQLYPNTTYDIYFKGISTIEYDQLVSNEIQSKGTTYDIARITRITTSPIFGLPVEINIISSSNKHLSLKIWTSGNNKVAEFIISLNSGNNIFTWNPTQDQLDQIYKTFSKSNSVPIYILLTTIGEYNTYDDLRQDKILTLTGIAKTAHIGIDNSPKRCQIWIGVNGQAKRCVGWIGVNGQARRTI